MARLASLAAFSLASLAALVAGCAAPDEPETESAPDERVGTAVSAITVGDAVTASCSTSIVAGLNAQIIAQANCISPGAYAKVPNRPNLTFGGTVTPYLEEPARDAFVAAVDSKPGTSITINSMLRTVAAQYLLYRWYQTGTCGIGLAAKPGTSNHETGLAFDTSQYSTWKSTFQAHGFTWLGSSDPVHFDYTGPGAVDEKGTDVLAFQVLWNKHHPEDLIAEDGAYGPQTEARLKQAPADGFADDVMCDPPPPPDAPDVVPALAFEDASDTFTDGASAEIADTFEGDASKLVVTLVNQGAATAPGVVVAFDIDGDFLEAETYELRHATAADAPSELDPANDAATNPAHDASLPGSFELDLGAMDPGETKTATFDLRALDYSVDGIDPASIHVWVKSIDGFYSQDAFGGDVVDETGSQTFNGGRLELASGLDVYAHTHWEWDSDRLEGATPSEGATLVVADGAVTLSGGEAGAWVATPLTSIDGAASTRVVLSARRSGGTGAARLLVTSDASGDLADAASFDLDLPDDGATHEVVVDASTFGALAGPITRLAIVPFDGAAGEASIDALAVEGGSIPTGPGDGDDPGTSDVPGAAGPCGCATPGAPPPGAPWALALAVGAASLTAARRRRRR
jgi:hypothetical protein